MTRRKESRARAKIRILTAKKKILEKNLKIQKIHQKDISRQINSLMDDIKAIDDDIDRIEQGPADTKITDHAILRYLERVRGINIAEVRDELLPKKVEEEVKSKNDSGVYLVAGSHKLMVKNNIIVTVLSLDME